VKDHRQEGSLRETGVERDMKIRRSVLIVFSGLDGAGKSTQIALLMDRLRQNSHKPHYVWTRGGYTPIFEMMKTLLRRFPGRVMPPSGSNLQRTQVFRKRRVRRLWLGLALLDLLWVYGIQLRWWQWRGRTVICDRYIWDTLIDFRLNFPQEQVEDWWLWRVVKWVAPQPQTAFLLLIPVEESMRRSDIKKEPFRDPSTVLTQRLEQYESLAREGYWHVMDGRRPIPDLAAEILEVLQQPEKHLSSSDKQTLLRDPVA